MSMLRRIRRARELTQEELARRCGVSRSVVALIEGGYMKPYPKIKRLISEVLGVDQDLIWPPPEEDGDKDD